MKATLLKKTLWVVAAILFSATVSAQDNWKRHQVATRTTQETTAATASENLLTIGYAMGYNETIYQGDGYSFNEEMRIGAAALFTRSMLTDYIGGKIVALRLGWNAPGLTATYDGFISKGINGEEIGTCSGNVQFGWNILYLDEPYEISADVEDLFAGFYVDVPANVVCIPTLFPEKTPNSCYLWNESFVGEDGEKLWQNFSLSDKPLAIHLVIEDSEGLFTRLIDINSLQIEEIAETGKAGTALLSLTNKGVESIRNIEVTTLRGDQSQSESVTLSRMLTAGSSSKFSVPLYCFGTGSHTLKISKVNGKDYSKEVDVNLVGIPASVAAQYTMRPLVEWFISENSYLTPRYTDEYFSPDFDLLANRMTLVCQHMDDQFMTGDDEATKMMLDFVNNDSSAVSIPAMMVNRAHYSSNLVAGTSGPAFPVLLPGAALAFYQNVLKHPTFASVDIAANLDEDGENAQIEVSGNIAEGILPDGESLFLTVYLMENDVVSDSQIFWDDKQSETYEGLYTHKNVIRQILTPFYGERVANGSGNYNLSFKAEIDPDWDKDKLAVVAFLNRDIKNGNFSAQVINSNVADVSKDPAGISRMEADGGISVSNGRITAARGTVEVFTSDGRQARNSRLAPGSYLVKVSADGKSAVRKILVK